MEEVKVKIVAILYYDDPPGRQDHEWWAQNGFIVDVDYIDRTDKYKVVLSIKQET